MTRSDADDLAEVRERIQDAKLAMLGVRADVIRLLISMAPILAKVEDTDPVLAGVLRDTLEAVIVGLELEGVMGDGKVDAVIGPDAAIGERNAKWRISLSRSTPPLHRFSRVLLDEEVVAVVQAVRLVAAEGDAACERAVILALPEDVSMWLAGHNDIPYDGLIEAVSNSFQRLALFFVATPTWTQRLGLRVGLFAKRWGRRKMLPR